MRSIQFRIRDGKSMIYDPSVGYEPGHYTYRINDIFNQYDSEPMQSTGIIDRNGKTIYEGDIIQYSGNSRYWTVYWDQKRCQFRFKCYGSISETYRDYGFDNELEYEVVGNIHENPDLINA